MSASITEKNVLADRGLKERQITAMSTVSMINIRPVLHDNPCVDKMISKWI